MRILLFLTCSLLACSLVSGQDVAVIAEKEAAVADATGMDLTVLREAMKLAQHGDTEASLILYVASVWV